MRPMFRD